MSTSAKTVGENNRGDDKSSRSFGGAMGNSNSYINVLKSKLSYSLMGRVKEFALLTNLKTTLLNEGFADLSVRYLRELWVLLEFSSSKTKEAFRVNVGVSSWFSEIRQASLDIIPDGRIVWVEVEGVPLKLWSMNTFRRIGYKIIFKGKVFWIRAKEVPGWVPDLIEESEEEEQSDVGSLEGDNKMNEDDLCGDNMDMADVPEIFLMNQMDKRRMCRRIPLTNVNNGIGDKSVNYNADEGTIGGDGVFVNVNSKGDDVDYEVVKVGQTMGYNMEGVVNNLSDIIESHGESLVNR
nr:glucose-methanol-choline oxidoreductase, FAD/NAD(P)-binding domain protein [Tanacetum cinerariifolium]